MKRTPTQIPPRGMGNGLERAYSKNNFIYYWLQYQWTEKIRNFLILIQAETKILQLWKNFEFLVERETPGGIWTLLRPLPDSIFLLFLSNLLKYSDKFRITYSQNHFKSTFGSAYFISKNNAVKLAKPAKKEPRKASFPWDFGLFFVHPIKVHWFCIILNFITSKGNIMHVIYKFSFKFMQKGQFPYN